MMMEWRETKAGRPRGGYSQRKMAGEIVRRPRKTVGDLVHSEFSFILIVTKTRSHWSLVSDIAIFVLKRDVKLQLTN